MPQKFKIFPSEYTKWIIQVCQVKCCNSSHLNDSPSFSYAEAEAKEVHTCLRTAAGIFEYVLVSHAKLFKAVNPNRVNFFSKLKINCLDIFSRLEQ